MRMVGLIDWPRDIVLTEGPRREPPCTVPARARAWSSNDARKPAENVMCDDIVIVP